MTPDERKILEEAEQQAFDTAQAFYDVPTSGIRPPPSIDETETVLEPELFGYDFGAQPSTEAAPTSSSEGGPPPFECPPTSPESFSIHWQASSVGLDDTTPPNPTFDVTRDYTLTDFPYCGVFGCSDSTPTWVESFSDQWCIDWGCSPGCSAGCGSSNDDTGDWCEAEALGPWEYHALATIEGHCSGSITINVKLIMRFGTVNGQTGWHVATQLYGDVPQGDGGCTDDCCADTENSFNLFPSPTVNHYIGPTLNGTVTIALRVWTFTLTFSS